jgi:hypothetical protein
MPQPMQKKPKGIASLDLDENLDESEAAATSEKSDQSKPDAAYQLALQYLERGMNQQKIADQLVQQGLSRPAANELARKVWKENLATRSQNVTILIGAGAFFTILGMAFLIPRLMNGGLPAFSPAYLIILFGLYLTLRAYFNWREIR